MHSYISCETHTGDFEVKNIALTVTVCIASVKAIGELQRERWKDCGSYAPQRLAGMGKCVDNSCKQRAEYLHRSLVIVHRECGQWQASFIWEKLACLAKVSVTEQISWNFRIPRNPGKTEHAQTVYQALFPQPTHKSLGTRLGRDWKEMQVYEYAIRTQEK